MCSSLIVLGPAHESRTHDLRHFVCAPREGLEELQRIRLTGPERRDLTCTSMLLGRFGAPETCQRQRSCRRDRPAPHHRQSTQQTVIAASAQESSVSRRL